MPKENLLARALPADVLGRVTPHLKAFSLARGKVLHRPGDTIHDLYFPLTCLISVTVTMGGGKTAETGVIGNRECVHGWQRDDPNRVRRADTRERD